MPEVIPQSGALTYISEGSNNQVSPYYSRSLHASPYATNQNNLFIGRGYDLCGRSKQQIYNDMLAIGIDANTANALSQAAGLSANSSQDFLQKNRKKIELTEEQQLKLFERMRSELEKELKSILTSSHTKSLKVEGLSRYQVDILVDLLQSGELRDPKILNTVTEVLSESVAQKKPQTFNRLIQDTKFWTESAKSHPERQKRRSAYLADTLKGGSSSSKDALGGINLDYTAEKLLKNPELFRFDGIHFNINTDGGVYLLQSRHGGKSVNLKQEGISMSDLAVCLKIYYDPAIKHKSISFSLDPYEPKNPDGPWMRKVFYPDTVEGRAILAGTKLGEDLFEADFILKQMSLGLKVDSLNPLKVSDFPFPQPLSQGGLKASYHMAEKRSYGQTNWSRKWIVIKGFKKDDLSSSDSLGDVLILNDLKMGVEARQMVVGQDGRLADKVLQDPSDGSFQFAKKLTELYDVAAKIYPSFERVRQIAKAMGVAHWMYRRRVPVDLNIVNELVERQRVKGFDDKVPALKRDESRTWEETKKVPIDMKALATNELIKRNVKVTDELVKKAIEQIKKTNPNSDFCETHITKHTETRFVFGGVQLSLESFEDNPLKESVKVEKAERAKIEDVLKHCDRVSFPLLIQESCEICSDYIRPLEARFPIEGKKYFCRYHHPYSCQSCFNVITGSYIPYKEKKFHESCVFCVYCEEGIGGNPLATDDGFLHEKCKDKYIVIKKEEAKREFEKKQMGEVNNFVKQNNLSFEKERDWHCSSCGKINTSSKNPVCRHCLKVDQKMVQYTQAASQANDTMSTMSSYSKKSVQ